MELSRLLNDPPFPPSNLTHHLISPSRRESCLQEILSDNGLQLKRPRPGQNESRYSTAIAIQVDKLFKDDGDRHNVLTVATEVPLSTLKRLPTCYVATPSLGRYRAKLEESPRRPDPSFSIPDEPPSASLSQGSLGLPASSRVSISTTTRKLGPCRPDIAIVGTPFSLNYTPDLSNTTLALNGTIEVKLVHPADLDGTVLEFPDGAFIHSLRSMDQEIKDLSSTVETIIRRGLAQALWYGALQQEMSTSPSTPDTIHDDEPKRPPMLVSLLVSGWFVRVIFQDRRILVERPNHNYNVEPSGQLEDQYNDLSDFLNLFQHGRHFPHHISQQQGASALFDYLYAAGSLILTEIERSTAPQPSPTTSNRQDLPFLPRFSVHSRPPPVFIPCTTSNVDYAGLHSKTGHEAMREASKTATAKTPSGSSVKTSTRAPSSSSGGNGHGRDLSMGSSYVTSQVVSNNGRYFSADDQGQHRDHQAGPSQYGAGPSGGGSTWVRAEAGRDPSQNSDVAEQTVQQADYNIKLQIASSSPPKVRSGSANSSSESQSDRYTYVSQEWIASLDQADPSDPDAPITPHTTPPSSADKPCAPYKSLGNVDVTALNLEKDDPLGLASTAEDLERNKDDDLRMQCLQEEGYTIQTTCTAEFERVLRGMLGAAHETET